MQCSPCREVCSLLGGETQQSPEPAGGTQQQDEKQRDHNTASYLCHSPRW